MFCMLPGFQEAPGYSLAWVLVFSSLAGCMYRSGSSSRKVSLEWFAALRENNRTNNNRNNAQVPKTVINHYINCSSLDWSSNRITSFRELLHPGVLKNKFVTTWEARWPNG